MAVDPNPGSARQKWADEVRRLRERELRAKEEENRIKNLEVQAKEGWTNPLVLAVLAAAVAAAGNAGVAWYNASAQLELERYKAEKQIPLEEQKAFGLQAVEETKALLEAVKIPDPKRALSTLRFLQETNQIKDKDRASGLQQFLNARPPNPQTDVFDPLYLPPLQPQYLPPPQSQPQPQP
jgi:hypothetical protein